MLTAMLLTVVTMTAPAGPTADKLDWPQWRGPNRDGKAAAGQFKAAPTGTPKVAWKTNTIGIGYGSPIVVGDRVFILGGTENTPGSPEHAVCLNLADGKEIWRMPLNTAKGQFLSKWGGGPRATPTFAHGNIYVLGSTGDLVAMSAADGKVAWAKNLVSDFGGKIPQWGYSESVLVDGDAVVCTPGNGTGMVSLNAKTGDVIWKCTDFNDGAGYSSIMTTEVGGTKIYVQQTMNSALGVDATTGKLAFKVGEIGRRIAVIPTPIVSDGFAFFTAGYGAGCECYKLSKSDGAVKATKVYTKFPTLANHHGGVIQVDDNVYGHSDRGGWTCFAFKQPKEDPLWQYSKFGKGSISFADGHFFCYAERSGDCAIIKPNAEKWDEVVTFSLPERSKTNKGDGAIWAHPVIAHGKLFLRDFDLMFCFDLK